jgi:hypothetical protein
MHQGWTQPEGCTWRFGGRRTVIEAQLVSAGKTVPYGVTEEFHFCFGLLGKLDVRKRFPLQFFGV